MAISQSGARYEHIDKIETITIDENTTGYLPQLPFSARDSKKKAAQNSEKSRKKSENETEIFYKINDSGQFECALCFRKPYKQPGYLKAHILEKHGKTMLFHCSYCKEGFIDNDSLKRHTKCPSGCPLKCD